jgi:enoyl-CoA hydratase/carnithine racemase
MFALAHDGPVARISLDRADAHNAIPTNAWADLADLAGRAVEEGARVLIVQSAHPQTFCAGADFGDLERLTGDPAAQRTMRTTMGDALARLSALPVTVIASIDGGCFGAGVALAMACDLRVAGHGAQFAIPPARLGISYPHRDIARLVALVGPGQAARLLLTGGRISADEAHRIGLVEITAHTAFGAVKTLAAECATASPASVAALKRSIAAATPEEHDRTFEALFDGPDFLEGLAAMRARRAPEFKR